MPIVNVYGNEPYLAQVRGVVQEVKELVAKELSVQERTLTPEEVSVRIVTTVDSTGMIGRLELDVSAHGYQERVARQDEICKSIAEFLREKTGAENVQVWLKLSELGHSYEI